LLCRAIGLAAGVGMAYLCAWAVMVMGHGKHFDTAVVFNLALPAVLGVVSAQFATWLVWPRLRRQRLIELDEQLNQRFAQQSRLLLQWLQQGGATPPLPLRSSDVLPAIQQLQQLSSLTNSRSLTPTMRRRWAQLGGLWRQLLSQWLLLEPQLLALAAPLPAEALSLLQAQLDQATGMRPRAMELPLWRHWAERSGAPPLLALGLAMQLDQLQRLQYSQALLRSHGLTTPPAGGR
jgi:hypothetical protein